MSLFFSLISAPFCYDITMKSIEIPIFIRILPTMGVTHPKIVFVGKVDLNELQEST